MRCYYDGMRAVIDTNVLFEGLTQRGASGDVVDAWVARKFIPCVSLTLALEYEEVLTNKLGPSRNRQAVGAMQALLARAEFVAIHYLMRPMSRDADDDLILEAAFNSSAMIVTRNMRDLRIAEQALGLPMLTPEAFLERLEQTWPDSP